MSGGQRSIASFFGGGGAKPAAPAKPDEAENVPPATKKPRLQKKSDIAAEEAARAHIRGAERARIKMLFEHGQ